MWATMTRDQITVAPTVASGKGDYGIYEKVVTMGNGWSHKKQYRHWSLRSNKPRGRIRSRATGPYDKYD